MFYSIIKEIQNTLQMFAEFPLIEPDLRDTILDLGLTLDCLIYQISVIQLGAPKIFRDLNHHKGKYCMIKSSKRH